MQAVPVLYHHESAGWWADSPAVPGWSATASTLDELRPLIEDGIRFALESDEVIVTHMLAPGTTPPGIRFDFVDHHVTVVGLPETPAGAEPALELAATA
jgi:predicted RNase H-like HicB family nuclease